MRGSDCHSVMCGNMSVWCCSFCAYDRDDEYVFLAPISQCCTSVYISSCVSCKLTVNILTLGAMLAN